MKHISYYFLLLIALAACAQKADTQQSSFPEDEKIEKSETAWKKELSEFEYYVLREKGTERAFTGKLLNNKDEGTYTCAACD
ncbi:MAG: peptide-methionine (R)-S-oxide reductase, partial [Bacteroidota bacterium]